MRTRSAARLGHLLTAVVCAFALVAQLVLVVLGRSVLVEGEPPGLGERLWRFVSYFTVQSNVLVLATAVTLARNPARDGRVWRVLRLDALTGILVTGLVHWFLLRPLLSLTGWSAVADTLLHVVVPVLALAGWLAFGPRPRITLRVVLLGLVWPAVWLLCTLLVGAANGWYPYPFLDVGTQGAGAVAVACLGVTGLLLVLGVLLWLADRSRFGRSGVTQGV